MTTENLFAPSAIKLFGREFKGLSVNQPLTGDSPPLEARARVPIDKIQEKLEHRQGYRQAPGRLERALRKVAANEKDEVEKSCSLCAHLRILLRRPVLRIAAAGSVLGLRTRKGG